MQSRLLGLQLLAGLLRLADAAGPSDPRDFSWIKTWAAVGDSFTAGIGSGHIWSDNDDSYKCSRYDQSYVALLNNHFGSVQQFNNLACSGATSLDVYKQTTSLADSSQDLIAVTAGGNDLCLTDMINYCILKSQTTEAACTNAITAAENFLNTQLGPNLDQVIDGAVKKLKSNGVLVYSLYAQFFNQDVEEPCHNGEDWVFPGTAGGGSLPLTADRRRRLNLLVVETNAVINKAIAAAQKRHANLAIQITGSDWDPWPALVGGRFCEPGEKPNPDDPANSKVQFFKLDTTKRPSFAAFATKLGDGRGSPDSELTGGNNTLDAVAALPMQGRDPVAPSCSKGLFGGGLPDNIGKIFHPNLNGHITMASFAGDNIISARAKILKAPDPHCSQSNERVCYQAQDSGTYASAYSLYSKTDQFCSDLVDQTPPNTANWHYSADYYSGATDAATWDVQLQNGATAVSYESCQAAVNQILDDCDGNDPQNPLDYKFGGSLDQHEAKWSIRPTYKQRTIPPYKTPAATCRTRFRGFAASWDIWGGGFAGWDWGQQSVLKNISHCMHANPTGWGFEYYPTGPDSNGAEWHAWGTNGVSVVNCMTAIIEGAGGPGGVQCEKRWT